MQTRWPPAHSLAIASPRTRPNMRRKGPGSPKQSRPKRPHHQAVIAIWISVIRKDCVPYGKLREPVRDPLDDRLILPPHRFHREPPLGFADDGNRNLHVLLRQRGSHAVGPFNEREARRLKILLRPQLPELFVVLQAIRVEVID